MQLARQAETNREEDILRRAKAAALKTNLEYTETMKALKIEENTEERKALVNKLRNIKV